MPQLSGGGEGNLERDGRGPAAPAGGAGDRLEVRGEEDPDRAQLGAGAGEGEGDLADLAVEAQRDLTTGGVACVAARGPRDLQQVVALRQTGDVQRLAPGALDIPSGDRGL